MTSEIGPIPPYVVLMAQRSLHSASKDPIQQKFQLDLSFLIFLCGRWHVNDCGWRISFRSGLTGHTSGKQIWSGHLLRLSDFYLKGNRNSTEEKLATNLIPVGHQAGNGKNGWFGQWRSRWKRTTSLTRARQRKNGRKENEIDHIASDHLALSMRSKESLLLRPIVEFEPPSSSTSSNVYTSRREI